MLSRFAIIPGALAETQSSSVAALELGIGCLNDLCRGEGIFADLREGDWSRSVDSKGPLAKKFLLFAIKERRLVQTHRQLRVAPDNDEEWLWEAQARHETAPFRALITDNILAAAQADNPLVTSIERLNLADWWARRSPSKNVPRTTAGYLSALELILRHSNSLMFIDAYIDPMSGNYREFPQLLMALGRMRVDRPLIEIHRASWRNIQGRKEGVSPVQWVDDFEPWSQQLARAGIKATVFLWEKMHDRYLISDLVGINVPYGFDIATDPCETSTWSRLGRDERDKQQKEFDRASDVHRLVNFFDIGAQI